MASALKKTDDLCLKLLRKCSSELKIAEQEDTKYQK